MPPPSPRAKMPPAHQKTLEAINKTWWMIESRNIQGARQALFEACTRALDMETDNLDGELMRAEGGCSALETLIHGSEHQRTELVELLAGFRKSQEEEAMGSEPGKAIVAAEEAIGQGEIKKAKELLLKALSMVETTEEAKGKLLTERIRKATGKILAIQNVYIALKTNREKTVNFAETLKKRKK